MSLGFFSAAGGLKGDAFHVGASAHDASDRIICNPIDGKLMYDSGGIGGEAATVFAKLSPGLSMTASDFILVWPAPVDQTPSFRGLF